MLCENKHKNLKTGMGVRVTLRYPEGKGYGLSQAPLGGMSNVTFYSTQEKTQDRKPFLFPAAH